MSSPTNLFQSVLKEEIQKFLDYKRALGCRFDAEQRALHLLDRYLVKHGITTLKDIHPELIESFLASRYRPRPRSYNHLLCTVRRLFDWLVQQGRLSHSPVQARPKRQTGARIPFIFDRQQAKRLLELAVHLPEHPRALLRGRTYRTIFALLYGLGLRVGEAARLLIGDVDLDRNLLIIRESKFYKSRLVPFGPRMRQELTNYLNAKSALGGIFSAETPLFSFTANRTICPNTVSQTFHALVPQLDLEIPAGTRPPCLHHLRHSFAVGTLLRWYRSGLDPSTRLLHLATFLGHVDVSSTAVYLTLTDALLDQANDRFHSFAEPVLQEGLLPCE